MSETNLQTITDALQIVGVVDETQPPTATQAANALRKLNNLLATEAVDGMRLGWYPQTNLAANSPLKDADLFDVKYYLAAHLAIAYRRKIEDPLTIAAMEQAVKRLTKRSIRYFESDLSELSRPQGGPWGGPNWL